jgi:AP-1 complex subunit mu
VPLLNSVFFENPMNIRSEGIKHRKNEIFLDVVEKLNLLVASNGTVLHSEIVGVVKMKSFLSGTPPPPSPTPHFFLNLYCVTGMPELKLGLNDKLMFEATGRSSG